MHNRRPRTANHTLAESFLGESRDDSTRRCSRLPSNAGARVRKKLPLHHRPVTCSVNISITCCSSPWRSQGGVRVEYRTLRRLLLSRAQRAIRHCSSLSPLRHNVWQPPGINSQIPNITNEKVCRLSLRGKFISDRHRQTRLSSPKRCQPKPNRPLEKPEWPIRLRVAGPQGTNDWIITS
jgi:hypothetical protein